MSLGNWRAPEIAGEMFIRPASLVDFVFTNKDEYYHLSGMEKGEESGVDVDHLAGEFGIKSNGLYIFDGVASLFPQTGMLVVFSVFVNSVVVTKIESGIDFKNSQDMQSFSGNGTIRLKKGDVVTVGGTSDTAGVTMRIRNLNIRLHRK